MRIAIKKCGKLFVHWSHLGAPSLEAPVSSPLRFHSGDIYSFLFLLSVHWRPKFSSESEWSHTEHGKPLGSRRFSFSPKSWLTTPILPLEKRMPPKSCLGMAGAARLELQNIPMSWMEVSSCFISPLETFILPELYPSVGLSNVSPGLMWNPAWFYWSLLVQQRKAPD